MSALRLALVPAVVGVVVVIGAFLVFASGVRTIQCDGSVPRWMIEAQDYDGGGCAEILPWWKAPAGADWSDYCLGLCTTFDPSR